MNILCGFGLHAPRLARSDPCVRKYVCRRCGVTLSTDKKGRELWPYLCADPEARSRFFQVQQRIGKLQQCECVWYIAYAQRTWDIKRHAGANTLVDRVRATIEKGTLPHTSITIFGLSFGRQHLFCLPDGIKVVAGRRIRLDRDRRPSVSYDHLGARHRAVSFREDDPIPKDARVVSHTWQYVRVDGQPDLRYARNREIPVVEYGAVDLTSPEGPSFTFHVSKAAYARELATALRDYIARQQRSAGKPVESL